MGKQEMRHAALLNPFSLGPEPAQPVHILPRQEQGRQDQMRQDQMRIVSRQASRSTPVCARCETDDIIAHVTAQWSNEQQQWELASTFDRPTHCNRCNAACEIRWIAL
jgi:hypothetical protein